MYQKQVRLVELFMCCGKQYGKIFGKTEFRSGWTQKKSKTEKHVVTKSGRKDEVKNSKTRHPSPSKIADR